MWVASAFVPLGQNADVPVTKSLELRSSEVLLQRFTLGGSVGVKGGPFSVRVELVVGNVKCDLRCLV